MRVYVAVCFAENEETNRFTDFADVVGVYTLKNRAEEDARKYIDELLNDLGVHSTYQIYIRET